MEMIDALRNTKFSSRTQREGVARRLAGLSGHIWPAAEIARTQGIRNITAWLRKLSAAAVVFSQRHPVVSLHVQPNARSR